MKHIGFIATCLFITACSDPAKRAAEQALYHGVQPYREQRYADAEAIYGAAAHDSRVAYNLGNSFYQQHLLDTALRTYARAIELSTGDTADVRCLYNMGHTWATLAVYTDSLVGSHERTLNDMRIEGNDIAQKVRQLVLRDSIRLVVQRLDHLVDSALAQSASAYKSTLRLTPLDEDARYDLASVQKRMAARAKQAADKDQTSDKKKDQALSERAKQLMQRADVLVDAFRFSEALTLLRTGLKAEPSLAKEQAYMNKLDVVTNAAQAK